MKLKRIISIALVFIMVLTLLPANAFAKSEQIIEGVWTVEIIDNEAYIIDCSDSESSVIEVPNKVNGYKVVGIGKKDEINLVFGDCNSVEKIIIPEGIKYIYTYSFCTWIGYFNGLYDDIGLSYIELPGTLEYIGENTGLNSDTIVKLANTNKNYRLENNGLYSYNLDTLILAKNTDEKDENLDLILPDEVEKIYGGAVRNCFYAKVVFSENVKYIGDVAFCSTHIISDFALPANVEHIGASAFAATYIGESVTIPKSVDYLGTSAFANSSLKTVVIEDEIKNIGSFIFDICEKLESVVLSDNMEIIPNMCFMDCVNLKKINIPSNLKKICNSAFSGCTNLEKIDLNEGLEHIGWNVFYDCASLKEIKIPSTVNFIGPGTFPGTDSLTSIEVDVNNKMYSSYDGILYDKSMHTLISVPSKKESFDILESTKVIQTNACTGNDVITSITIPKSVETIEDLAFAYCKSLNEIIIKGKDTCFEGSMVFSNDTLYESVDNSHRTIYGSIDSDAYYYAKAGGFNFKLICNLQDHEFKDATCKTAKKCINCNLTEGNPLGHIWEKQYTVDTPATFYQIGSKSIHCSRCNAKKNSKSIVLLSALDLSSTKMTYNGKNRTPAVFVYDDNGKELKKGRDYDVFYEKDRSKVGRYKVTVKMKGDYSGTHYRYYTIVPKATTNTKANLYGYDDVKVTWYKSKGASGYSVYYKKSTSKSDNYKYYKRTAGTSMNISNLSDGIKYDFKVVPYYSSANNIRYSSLQSSVTSTYTLKKVSTPTITKSGTKVKVKWSNIPGETGYQISKSTSKTGTYIVSTYKTTNGTYKKLSATKGKTYYYKVRAYKVVDGKKIYAPWSKVTVYKR